MAAITMSVVSPLPLPLPLTVTLALTLTLEDKGCHDALSVEADLGTW